MDADSPSLEERLATLERELAEARARAEAAEAKGRVTLTRRSAPPRPRVNALDRARTSYREAPHAPYEYPDLPEAADPAMTFYAVYLANLDGTILRGPHPAFLETCDETIVADEQRPWIDPGFEMATTQAQQELLENLRPNLAKDADGTPIQHPARRWRYRPDLNQVWFEDPRIAAKRHRPFVRKIELYCPLTEEGSSGALEDHGPYPGLNAQVPDDYDDPLGVCPKCAGSDERQQAALRALVGLYESANRPLPGPLAERMLSSPTRP